MKLTRREQNNFLLSSSMDKTVRLWHVSRDECLCAFQVGARGATAEGSAES